MKEMFIFSTSIALSWAEKRRIDSVFGKKKMRSVLRRSPAAAPFACGCVVLHRDTCCTRLLHPGH